jgi:hypothetical protein
MREDRGKGWDLERVGEREGEMPFKIDSVEFSAAKTCASDMLCGDILATEARYNKKHWYGAWVLHWASLRSPQRGGGRKLDEMEMKRNKA